MSVSVAVCVVLVRGRVPPHLEQPDQHARRWLGAAPYGRALIGVTGRLVHCDIEPVTLGAAQLGGNRDRRAEPLRPRAVDADGVDEGPEAGGGKVAKCVAVEPHEGDALAARWWRLGRGATKGCVQLRRHRQARWRRASRRRDAQARR